MTESKGLRTFTTPAFGKSTLPKMYPPCESLSTQTATLPEAQKKSRADPTAPVPRSPKPGGLWDAGGVWRPVDWDSLGTIVGGPSFSAPTVPAACFSARLGTASGPAIISPSGRLCTPTAHHSPLQKVPMTAAAALGEKAFSRTGVATFSCCVLCFRGYGSLKSSPGQLR